MEKIENWYGMEGGRNAFLEAHKRGQRTVLLYEDTDSLTNAHRLYAQAGMSPDIQTALYKKML